MALVELSHINKSYNGNAILKDVTLSAAKGEVITLVGRSGSGKSTLLRCINLLTLPDSGTYDFKNTHITFNSSTQSELSKNELSMLRAKIGMVFQDFNLWPHLSVIENLILAPTQVLKVEREKALDQAEQLLIKVGLKDKFSQYPHQLSGGQQQRVALARALMMQPEIMLFDEPTSALDPAMVGEVLQVMKDLSQEGMTMLIATHELSFAKRIATRAIFLEEGQVIEEGGAQTFFSTPNTHQLTSFLNAVNF